MVIYLVSYLISIFGMVFRVVWIFSFFIIGINLKVVKEGSKEWKKLGVGEKEEGREGRIGDKGKGEKFIYRCLVNVISWFFF